MTDLTGVVGPASGATRLLDVNALVALVWDQHIHHRAARAGVRALPSFATTPVTESGLIRLLLTPAVVGRPVAVSEALSVVTALRAHGSWRWLPDDTSVAQPVVDLRVLVGRAQVTDLHLVNLAAKNGCVLATFDAAIPQWLAPNDRRHVDVWKS